jgi:hypothetical protein
MTHLPRVHRTGNIPPGGTVQVNMTGSYRINATPEKYCFTATAIDAPNEFGQTYETCAPATCSYNFPPRLIARPEFLYRMQGGELKLAPKSEAKILQKPVAVKKPVKRD